MKKHVFYVFYLKINVFNIYDLHYESLASISCFLVASVYCKISLICAKQIKNVIKICYSKRKCVSASGGLRPPDPLPGLRPWTPLGVPRPPHLCSSKFSLKKPWCIVTNFYRIGLCRPNNNNKFIIVLTVKIFQYS